MKRAYDATGVGASLVLALFRAAKGGHKARPYEHCRKTRSEHPGACMMKKAALLLCALALPVYAQTRMECLGYHVVDVAGEVEEATEPVDSRRYSQIGGGQFSETLRVMNDGFDSGELTVEVSDPTTREKFDKSIPRKLEIIFGDAYEPTEIQYIRSEIKQIREMVAGLERKGRSKEDIDPWRKKIASYEADVKAWEAMPEIWIDKDSYYYEGWLWLWRAPRIFRIRMNEEAIPQGKSWQETTLAVVPRFRTRALGEIPAEPGFCVPYGFIQGVSPLPYRSQTTLRMKDEPGLLYTVRFQSQEHGAQRGWFYDDRPNWGEPFTPVKESVQLLGVDTILKGWTSPTPYKESKLPNGRYRVEVKGPDGQPMTVERSRSKGDVFVLTAFLDGAEKDSTKPATFLQFNAFSFLKIDPVGLQAPSVKPMKKHLPALKRFVNSLRMRPENEKAFKEMGR